MGGASGARILRYAFGERLGFDGAGTGSSLPAGRLGPGLANRRPDGDHSPRPQRR